MPETLREFNYSSFSENRTTTKTSPQGCMTWEKCPVDSRVPERQTHRASMLGSLVPQEPSQDVYITRQETRPCVSQTHGLCGQHKGSEV